jgi:glycosyltransferase involved in cell wall biosynthesis
VALISRTPAVDVVKNIPGFEDDMSRVIAGTYGDVCSSIPQFREIFSDLEVAYFVLDDRDGLISAIKYACAEGSVLSAHARKRFYACFTKDVMVRNYLDYFESLCQGSQR